MSASSRACWLACIVPFVLAACSSKSNDPPAPVWPAPKVDLRADNNRNGTVDLDDPTEDEGEDGWDGRHGAILLANIDDDQRACPTTGLTDVDLPSCNDAANDVVDGDDDLLDLARLKTAPWAEVPEGARGTLEISAAAAPFVRLFKKGPDGFVAIDPAIELLSSADVAAGVELAIEAKDVVRDKAVWDGFVDVTWRVVFDGTPGGRPAFEASDTVRMRVAPVLLQHHVSPAEKVFTTKILDAGSTAFRADLAKAVTAAKTPNGMEALDGVPDRDPWTQDFFETGYMSMPAPGGEQHVVRVAIRSSNIYRDSLKNPLRPAGKLVFTNLRGKDVAGLQQFDPRSNPDMDSLNSFGNTETIPPFEHAGKKWPLGRIIRGATPSFYPDRSFAALLAAQGVQDPVFVDTSWLFVSHLDETLSFVPAPKPTQRSFLLLANDARLAKKMLEDAKAAGQGGTKMFLGKYWLDEEGVESPAEVSIDDVLADPDVMAASAEAAAEVDAQIEVLARETGLTTDEIVPIPFLHSKIYGGSVAYQPGMVNALVLDATHLAAPDPHGPMIEGKDPFQTAVEAALAPHGVSVTWVEDWDGYHRNLGEVHCGSNVMRAIPTAKWWEAAR
ncbi:MAG: protein-arginine deiminase [Deltaproteobacteria bacterium]|nr:protein-arginine deiminase [Deltaproteobacteria bacterium]